MSEPTLAAQADRDAASVARDVYGSASSTINRYVDILTDRGIAWGLLGPREVDRLWDRHILNSLALAELVPADCSVIDVGSGAGLPGIPLAVYRPDLRVTLLEPLLRRVNFLTQAVDELDLGGRVQVVRGRAEEHETRYDVVVARALAPLPRLVTWCASLIENSGTILALKGSAANQELADATSVLDRYGLGGEVVSVSATPTSQPTSVIQLTRV